jgi:glycerophosphoryl diester phosphodiesterase
MVGMKRRKTPLIVGHRGSRGLEPENSLKAFQKAFQLGARGLEMDLFITKDGEVVVTHDATISPDLCLMPNGKPVSAKKSQRLKIYNLLLEEIKPYDCGSKPNPRFPEQENTEAHIPLLVEVVRQANNFAGAGEEAVQLFIEFKSDAATDNVYHPEPHFFVKRTLEVLRKENALEQTILLSFDKRCLQEARRQQPDIQIGLSLENPAALENELDTLGFLPNVLCPLHRELNSELLRFSGKHGLAVVPWTVNDEEDIRSMIALGVDGIITDFPDKARKIIQESV